MGLLARSSLVSWMEKAEGNSSSTQHRWSGFLSEAHQISSSQTRSDPMTTRSDQNSNCGIVLLSQMTILLLLFVNPPDLTILGHHI